MVIFRCTQTIWQTYYSKHYHPIVRVFFRKIFFSRIPAAHPVRLVNEVVDKLNIDHIVSRYKGGGTTSFHPRMMIKVLFYAYLSNIYSCRKIERALQENIYYQGTAHRITGQSTTSGARGSKGISSHFLPKLSVCLPNWAM